jgi:hypothetical protein
VCCPDGSFGFFNASRMIANCLFWDGKSLYSNKSKYLLSRSSISTPGVSTRGMKADTIGTPDGGPAFTVWYAAIVSPLGSAGWVSA